MPRSRVAIALLSACAVAATASALEPPRAARGDLARALRRFEAAWDEGRDTLTPDRTRKIAGHVTKATFAFFSGGYEGAVGDLARATAVLRGTASGREGVRLRVERLLVAPSGTVRATVTRTLSGTAARVELVLLEGARAVARAAGDLDGAAGSTARLEIGAGEGTTGRLELALRVDDAELERQTVSVAADAEGRLARVREAVGKLDPSAVRAPTLRARVARLARVLEGGDDGVDRDLAAELAGLEKDSAAVAAGEDPFAGRAGDELRAIRSGRDDLPYRQIVPAQAGPRPLVIALHGVGGDEDMFVEAYGRGILRRLAAQAGAILVTPRSPGGMGMTPSGAHALAILDAVARDHAVDPERIYLVGHSMGAGQAGDAVRRAPGKFRAVALFGGAGLRPAAEAPPLFLACGSADFAAAGVRSLAASAREKGMTVTFDERPDLEHLLAVRECLPAAFDFFAARGLARFR